MRCDGDFSNYSFLIPFSGTENGMRNVVESTREEIQFRHNFQIGIFLLFNTC